MLFSTLTILLTCPENCCNRPENTINPVPSGNSPTLTRYPP